MDQIHSGAGDNVGRKIVYIGQQIVQYQGQRQVPRLLTKLPRLTDKIIGREEELNSLYHTLETSQKVVLMNGMGGVGKTTVATAFANRYQAQYTHIAWIEQLGDFATDLAANTVLTTNLGVTPSGDPTADAQLILNTLANLGGKSLLILDNGNEELQQYKDYFPQAPDWHVLITSRQELPFAKKTPLNFLTEEDALRLFYTHYEWDKDDKVAKKILKTADYHTLTVEMLAKTAQNLEIDSLQKLAELLEKRGIQIGKPVDFSTIAHSKEDQTNHLFPYLKAIFQLPDMGDRELHLLKHFVALPPTFHRWEIITALIQISQEEETVWDELIMARNALKRKGWIIYEEHQQTYKMHRIIQEVVAAQVAINENDITELLESLLYISTSDPRQNPVQHYAWIPFWERLLVVLGTQKSDQIRHLYNKTGLLYQKQGRYKDALDSFRKAVDISEAILDSYDPELATQYNNLAAQYQAQGHFELSLRFNQKAISIGEAVLDSYHPDLAKSYNNLAVLYQDQGRYNEASIFFDKAIKIWEAILEPEHPDLATSYNNIALLYLDQGQFQAALVFMHKAIKIWEATLEPQHPDLAASYNNIAMVYRSLDQFQKALIFIQKAIKIWEATLEPQHPGLATAYNNIGLLYINQDHYKEGYNFTQMAIQTREAELGLLHPDLATSYSNMALLYKKQGQYEKALIFLHKSTKIREKVLEVQHPDLATSYEGLVALYKTQGKYVEATIYLRKLVKIKEGILETQHPDLANYYNNIAWLYQEQECFQDASTYYQKALEILQKSLGENHPHTRIVDKNLEALRNKMSEGLE